jgi:hypothetical protein
MRNAVVADAKSFIRSLVQFPQPGQSYESGLSLKSAAVMKYWGVDSGGLPQVTDCNGAAKIIMARGLMDVITPQTFDALYTSGSVPMKGRSVPISQMKPGDWGYLQNDWDYLTVQPGGPAMGENIIKLVGNDSYFDFPNGALTLAGWTQSLIAAYNIGLADADKITTIPGWLPQYNQFLDVATIAMNVFDLRNKKPG